MKSKIKQFEKKIETQKWIETLYNLYSNVVKIVIKKNCLKSNKKKKKKTKRNSKFKTTN